MPDKSITRATSARTRYSDHCNIRLFGRPSPMLKASTDPLKVDPVAHVNLSKPWERTHAPWLPVAFVYRSHSSVD